MDARRQTSAFTRAAVLALAAGVAVLALAVGWRLGWLHAEASRPLQAAPTPQALLSPAPQLVRPLPPTDTRLMVMAPRRPAPRATGLVEVCGFGVVQVPPDDPDPVQRIPRALRQSALDTMDALMLASDDPQVRAAALWMGARLRGRDVRGRIEQVARLAASSQDPFVYAMAMEACKGRSASDSGSCRLLSTAQWVRLDPDNAVPWRALAAEARDRDEPLAELSALQFADRAARSDVHAGRLPLLVEKAMGPQGASLQRTLALSAGWSAEAVWAASHGQPAVDIVGELAQQGADLSCDNVDRMQRRWIRVTRR
ncbi:MAG: hypothetical protein H7Z15_19010 [Rhizobacter sp.]|nr:hypothetical protein [Rhizobacter sp.]